ncbi:MAG: hypothetical protein M3443_16290, partial [Actinomycetota bacterium]|nr:hypothetical protein [Actinomycetota bacterium]
MAETKTGLLLPLLAVAGLVAYFGLDTVTDPVGDLFSDVTSADPVIIEDNGYQLLVGSDSEAKVKQCTADQVLKDKRCGDLKVVVIDTAKMPFISRNISLAWGEGRQSILNRDADDNNRAA